MLKWCGTKGLAALRIQHPSGWAKRVLAEIGQACLGAIFGLYLLSGVVQASDATLELGFSQVGASNVMPVQLRNIDYERPDLRRIVSAMDGTVPDVPWLTAETRAWTEFRGGTLGFAHRFERQVEATANQPAGWVLQALYNNEPLPAGVHAVDLQVGGVTYEAIDVIVSMERGVWKPFVRVGLLEPVGWTRLHASGSTVGDGKENSEIPLRMHFHTLSGNAGIGWALGGGVEVVGDGYRVHIEVVDAAGQLTWFGTNVRAGLLDTDRMVIGVDGYPSRQAVAQGRYWQEDRQSSPFVRWRLGWHWGTDVENPLVSFQIERTAQRFSGLVTYRIAPRFALRLGAIFPPSAIQTGFTWDSWQLDVLARPATSGHRSLGFALGRKIAF